MIIVKMRHRQWGKVNGLPQIFWQLFIATLASYPLRLPPRRSGALWLYISIIRYLCLISFPGAPGLGGEMELPLRPRGIAPRPRLMAGMSRSIGPADARWCLFVK
jgi:hypothetical protein